MPRPPSPSRLPSALRIEPAPLDSDGVRWVMAQAEAELLARYGFLGDGELAVGADTFAPPRGVFPLGRIPSAVHPVGGVGLRPVTPTVGEVKRLWVDEPARGLGLGRALMGALEAAARHRGYESLRLETGPKQPEAMALYASSGWDRHEAGWDVEPGPPAHGFRFVKALG